MRAIRGIPGLHVKAYAGSPEASSVAIKIRKVGAPHLTFSTVVFEYGANVIGLGPEVIEDACIFAAVLGKESK